MIRFSDIFPDSAIICVAEVGINHDGNLQTAFEMITSAQRAGAHAVKIQTIVSSKLYSRYTNSFANGTTALKEDYATIKFFDRFYFTPDEHRQLFLFAHKLGITLFSTAFDCDSVDMLADCGAKLYKIASCDVTYLPLIEHIAKKGAPVVLSTGMSSFDEVTEAVTLLKGYEVDVLLLHCVSLYPTPLNAVNLDRIDHLRDRFGNSVGLSDHSNDLRVINAAYFKKIKMIECHYTDNYGRHCPDQVVSYDEEKFRSMVDNISALQEIDCVYSEAISADEAIIARLSHRSLFAKKSIKAGEVISEQMLAYKRPGLGIPANQYKSVLGKRARVDILEDMPILPKNIK